MSPCWTVRVSGVLGASAVCEGGTCSAHALSRVAKTHIMDIWRDMEPLWSCVNWGGDAWIILGLSSRVIVSISFMAASNFVSTLAHKPQPNS
jgi:hypothetical protein